MVWRAPKRYQSLSNDAADGARVVGSSAWLNGLNHGCRFDGPPPDCILTVSVVHDIMCDVSTLAWYAHQAGIKKLNLRIQLKTINLYIGYSFMN